MVKLNQPERYTAVMIADSISPQGTRLSTMHVHMPRIILAEANTHRVFSRNAGSTRAKPTDKLIAEVRENPYLPLRWLKNKSGMQATEEMSYEGAWLAEREWISSAHWAATHSEELFASGLHKQWAGRPLEPYLFVDWLVTSTDWANFMALRDHGDAQPEIELVAQRMRDCLDESEPRATVPGEWHMPYVTTNDFLSAEQMVEFSGKEPAQSRKREILLKVSAARCARVSYTPFAGDGDASIAAELKRYDRLITARPVHASPVEHQATPDSCRVVDGWSKWQSPELHGNLRGWVQHRKLIPFENVTEMPERRCL